MIVKQNQSMFDLSAQIFGDIRSVVDLAIQNNVSITQELEPGTEISLPNTVYVNEIVSSFFFNNSYELATSSTKSPTSGLGIGTMIVESDFIVS